MGAEPRFSHLEVVTATGARPTVTSVAGYEGVSTDSRTLPPGALFVALRGERFDAHAFLADVAAAGAAGAVVQVGHPRSGLPPGFPLYEVSDTLQALGALGRFHRRRFRLPLGAVGGSNGKTTTKEMVGAILAARGPSLKTEGNLNNEVGVPLTLFRLRPEHVAAVVELGMNHPGEMARLTAVAEPDAALITTIQPEHLEGLGSLQGVAEAEGELFAGLSPRATAAINVDDAHVAQQGARTRGPRIGFGRAPGADVRLLEAAPRGKSGLALVIETAGRRWPVSLGFVGEHNALNATGAFALATALGFRPEECVQGLEAARPYARRLNVVEAAGGWTVVDDCYNANPASMAAALDTARTLAAGGRVVVVLGDMLELGPGEQEDHVALGARVSQVAGLAAFLGPRSAWIAGAAPGVESAHFLEVDPLWDWLGPRLRPGDLVLVKGSRGMRLERVVEKLTGVATSGGH
ncbi:MAG: UDP-N-acetylmuramoyl-tripeptide--D-alanyl-D-alanine ligase [Myxococcaceae bacterium]